MPFEVLYTSSAMGAVCDSLCEPAVDSAELEQLFRDNATGKLLGLTAEERRKYCGKIREMPLREGMPNELFPDAKRQEGFLYCPQRYFYEGRMKERVPHGKGRLVLLGPRVAVEGWFREGRAEGECVAVGGDVRVEGRWQGGLPHQVRLRSGERQYFIQFELPSLTKGKIIFPNGNTYLGEFRFDFEQKCHVIQGKGVFTYVNGNSLEGVFVNGCLEGEGVFESKSQACVYRGSFKGGLFEGAGVMEMGEKGVLRIGWRANRPEGEGEFMSNGSVAKISYLSGVRQSSRISRDSHEYI